jgi:hypothetical protein
MSGDNLTVSQTTAAGIKVNSKSKPKANLPAESTVAVVHDDGNSLSDEDDSIERVTILQSLPKGTQHLSSAVSHFSYVAIGNCLPFFWSYRLLSRLRNHRLA